MSLLICYDGSADAKAAIQRAGELFGGRRVVVLTVWDGFSAVLARTGAALGAAALDFDEIDRETRKAAEQRADEGVGIARVAGLDARPAVVERLTATWETILEEAERINAEAIIIGTRGLTGVKSAWLGSVSHGVVQHADRPVIVVPADEVARRRSARLRDHDPVGSEPS